MVWLSLGLTTLVILLLLGISYYFRVRLLTLEKKIAKEVKDSIVPKFLDVSVELNFLVDLGVEFWRLKSRLQKIENTIEDSAKKNIASSFQKIERYLETHDIEIQDHTNKPFNDGLNVDVLSVVKEEGTKTPVIKETVEPSVMSKGQLVKRAKVIVMEGKAS